MQSINWNSEKNRELLETRGISFEDVVVLIQQGDVLDIMKHPNQEKYPDQSIFILLISDYVYLVPFVESPEEIFLKTIIPSRKATRQYLGGK